MSTRHSIGFVAGLLLLGACSDSPTPLAPSRTLTPAQESEGRGAFQRYVAMGTSVSMGWQSDGVTEFTQMGSWPAQLSRLAGREMTQPYIANPGCKAPIAAPIAGGRRVSGEPIAISDTDVACTQLLPGVTLPTQNVAISGATTQAALTLTPQSNTHPLYGRLYPLILPPAMTQLQSATAQNPKVISVEFGANEVLGSRSGLAVVGQTIFPFPVFQSLYTQLTDAVKETKYGVLVGLIDDVADFPSFRRGSEIWADRATMLSRLYVQVDANCDASDNLLFVPVLIPTAAAAGGAAARAGQPPYTLSCANVPGQQDYILTPAEVAVINNTMQAMDAFIAQRAQDLGFAHFRLEALYGMANLKAPFSALQLLGTAQPYGPYISLDGIHPSAQGHAVLAQAAARAINTRYGLGIPESLAFIANR